MEKKALRIKAKKLKDVFIKEGKKDMRKNFFELLRRAVHTASS